MARFFWSLVTPEQAIAGLEISDTHIRIVLLGGPTKKHPFINVQAHAEVELAPGVVERGVVVNAKKLTEAIQLLRTATASTTIRYVVLSIPTDRVYTEVLSFPKSIRLEKLHEAVELATHLELPFPFSEAYVDWEEHEGIEKREAHVAAVRKTIIQTYIQAIEPTGLRVVAIEYHPLSALRALQFVPDQNHLLAIPGRTSLTLAVSQGSVVRIIRTETHETASEDIWNQDVEHLLAYAEAQQIPVTSFLNLKPNVRTLTTPSALPAQAIEWNPALKAIQHELTPSFAIAAGAAWRGLIPRSQDRIISLMDVGTEDTYAYQKITVLAEFLSASTIALSLLLSTLFVAAWLFMVNLQQQISIQNPLLSIPTYATDTLALQERTQALNHLVQTADQIILSAPQWSKLLQAIQERAVGVSITSFNFPSTHDRLSVEGIAGTRADLNNFKKSLGEIPFLDHVDSPITHVYQKESIPFTVTFMLRDPNALGVIAP